MFEGVSVAMVTPFRDGQLDYEAADRVLAHLLAGGVDGVLPLGTTGEGATVTREERRAFIEFVVGRTRGRAWVAPGTGSNDTATTIELTREARSLGADGALVVTPFYNKPTQDGLRAHFEAVASAAGFPLILYNVPSRTSVNLLPETVTHLAQVPEIVAIKEASGNPDQTTEICRDTDLTVLSGDDSLTLPLLAVGAKGVVSVVGHLAPAALQEMVRAFRAGRVDDAVAIHQQLFALTRALFSETNPAPVKHALAHWGWIREEVRLPLVPMGEANARRLDAILDATMAALPERFRPEIGASTQPVRP